MFPKPQRWQSKKYRYAARDQSCTMRLDGCNFDTSTTVLAHANGGGMGTKSSDHDAADMCSSCHDVFDGRKASNYTKEELLFIFQGARYATLVNRITRGVLK